MLKIILIIIFCVVGIIFGFITPTFDNQLFSGIVTMLGIMSFLVQYLYTNIDKIYIALNRLKQRICNPKFDLIQSTFIEFDEETLEPSFLEEILNKIKLSISDRFDIRTRISSRPSQTNATLEMDENGIGQISLKLSQVDDYKYSLFIKYKNSVEYNDRFEEIEKMRNIIELIAEQLSVTNKIFQIRLFFKDKNPFYGYILKKQNSINVNEFELNFAINNKIDVHVGRHYLEINSADYGQFSQILKDLTILPNVNDE